MRIRELYEPNILIMLTNEESDFLITHRAHRIDLKTLEERDRRIAENLLFKDVLYKISDHEVATNEYVPREKKVSTETR
jgi:hypothetical protein